MTTTSWSRASAASRSREVEYKLGLRERMAIFNGVAVGGGRRDCTATGDEGTVRVDHEAAPDGGPTQQHAKAHFITPCQGQVDPEPPAREGQRRAHHGAAFDVTVAGPDVAHVDQRRLHPEPERLVVLERVEHEAETGRGAPGDHLDVPGVQ